MVVPKYKAIRLLLNQAGWSEEKLNRFIELNPRVWLTVLNSPIEDAVDSMFVFDAHINHELCQD